MEFNITFIRAFFTLSIYIVMCESEDKGHHKTLASASVVALVEEEVQIFPDIAIATSDLSTNERTEYINSPAEDDGSDFRTNKILSNSVAKAVLRTPIHSARTEGGEKIFVNNVPGGESLEDSIMITQQDKLYLQIDSRESTTNERTPYIDSPELSTNERTSYIDTLSNSEKLDETNNVLLLLISAKTKIPSHFEQNNAVINPLFSYFRKHQTFSGMADLPSEKSTLSLSNNFLQDDTSNNFVKFEEIFSQNPKTDISMLPSSKLSEPKEPILVKSSGTREIMPKLDAKISTKVDYKDDRNKWLRKRRLAGPPPVQKPKKPVVHVHVSTKVPPTSISAKININSILNKHKGAHKDVSTTRASSTADIETTSITGSEVEIVEDREPDRKCTLANGCLATRTQPLSSDAYWAAGSLLSVLLILTIAVLYTGLLRRRNDFDTFSDDSQDDGVEMETMNSSLNIQNILKKIPPHLSHMSRSIKYPRRHFQGNKYRRLPDLTEHDSDSLMEDEEENQRYV
ncbi:uncharacterized protein [Amphiura filiformis]|uniref:uncharacterized protein n=1 Tax=Amphiura filiformis TaxID=82378 RepID=UPI003B210100